MKITSSLLALASAAVVLVSACGLTSPTGSTSSTGSTSGVGGHGGSSSSVTGSATGVGGTASASTGTGGDANCTHCALAISSIMKIDTLCPNSAAKYAAMLACTCTDTCAPVCSTTVATDGGVFTSCGLKEENPSLACKSCMVNLMGCGVEFNACVNDDGSAPVATTSASTGSGCSCPAGVPLCPGGSWECTQPGDYTHGIPSCGAAQYCAPCCDPTDSCMIRGNCNLTKVSNEPCAANYECCSNVCVNGKCFGGCGIILHGSGAGSSTGTGG